MSRSFGIGRKLAGGAFASPDREQLRSRPGGVDVSVSEGGI
ncbi:hypothetical protein Y88_1919 [Novosphingobium nitrogenifigens DSM 19370]|uniref:Uncharacterized protein n=1 Tax=Novosphingobium nitrogenifigens DSM 19370 TaxID=983920 RepID=F1Z506_9SPHN|nr:hypothetical protein Y88_1919 [Novosphingobium nitrogenifigens DSM 19370]